MGTVGCFSFQQTKVLPGGEAGALVSDHPDSIDKAYTLRDFGRDPKEPDRYIVRGTKYRISDFPAAVLMAQITRFEEVCARREKNAAYLREEIKRIPGIVPQEHYPESTRQTHCRFGLRYDKARFNGLERSKLIRALSAEGVPAEEGYRPLNKDPFIEQSLTTRGYRAIYSEERLNKYREQNRCPRNDQLCATALALPHEVLLGMKQDVDDVVAAFGKVQENSAAF